MEKKKFVYLFAESVRKVTDWEDRLIQGLPGVVRYSDIQPDLILEKHGLSPIVFALGFGVDDDTVSDVERLLGLEFSDISEYSAGLTIKFGVAVRCPIDAKKWNPEEVMGNLLEGAEIEWKFVRLSDGNSAGKAFVEWPEIGWIRGNVAHLAESVMDAVVTGDMVAEVADKAVEGIMAIAGMLGNDFVSQPEGLKE